MAGPPCLANLDAPTLFQLAENVNYWVQHSIETGQPRHGSAYTGILVRGMWWVSFSGIAPKRRD